jgi:outer membrane lipoprotein-sorting protein
MIRKTVLMCAAAAALLCVPSATYAQTADDIVAKNIAAKGGEAKLKAVQTLRESGTIMIQGQPAQLVTLSKRPNLSRQEITIMGQTITMAFDGTKAWMLNPMMGAEAMELPAEQAEMIKDQADIDGPLMDYKAKGSTVELVGLEDTGGKKAFHLRVTRKGLPPQELFIDSTTYLDLKAVTSLPGSGTMEIAFDDYRTIDGLTVPFSVKSSAAGMTVSELKLDKVEFNVTLAPDTFKIKK